MRRTAFLWNHCIRSCVRMTTAATAIMHPSRRFGRLELLLDWHFLLGKQQKNVFWQLKCLKGEKTPWLIDAIFANLMRKLVTIYCWGARKLIASGCLFWGCWGWTGLWLRVWVVNCGRGWIFVKRKDTYFLFINYFLDCVWGNKCESFWEHWD